MKLIPKTRKGKNKIHEAGTDQWHIRRGPRAVEFSKGLWVLIDPCGHTHPAMHSRWLRWDEPDKDFDLDKPCSPN